MGNKRLRGSRKFCLRRAFIEQRPAGATRIAGIENDISSLVVKGLDKCPGQIEDNRAAAACADLGTDIPELCRLARTGCANQDRVARFQSVGIRNSGQTIGMMQPGLDPFGKRQSDDLRGGLAGK